MNKWAVAGFVFGVACLLVAGYILFAASQQPGLEVVEETAAPPPAAAVRPEPAPATDTPSHTLAGVSMERRVAGGKYVPGQPLDVTLVLNRTGTEPLFALGIKEALPEGWSFAGVLTQDVSRPDVHRAEGREVDFAWINIPQFPLTLSYRVVTAAEPNEVELMGEALYRTTGPELSSGAVVTPLEPGTEAEIQAARRTQEAAAAPAPPPAPVEPVSPVAERPAQIPRPPVPPPRPVAREEVGLPGSFRITMGMPDTGYTPGETLALSMRAEHSVREPVQRCDVELQLPAGWSMEGVEGADAPAMRGEEGGRVNLAWDTAPAWPAEFTVRLAVPAEASGPQILKSEAVYFTAEDGPGQRSGAVGVVLRPAE